MHQVWPCCILKQTIWWEMFICTESSTHNLGDFNNLTMLHLTNDSLLWNLVHKPCILQIFAVSLCKLLLCSVCCLCLFCCPADATCSCSQWSELQPDRHTVFSWMSLSEKQISHNHTSKYTHHLCLVLCCQYLCYRQKRSRVFSTSNRTSSSRTRCRFKK